MANTLQADLLELSESRVSAPTHNKGYEGVPTAPPEMDLSARTLRLDDGGDARMWTSTTDNADNTSTASSSGGRRDRKRSSTPAPADDDNTSGAPGKSSSGDDLIVTHTATRLNGAAGTAIDNYI